MRNYGEEQVLVVPADIIQLPPDGVSVLALTTETLTLLEENCHLMLRNDAEGNPAFKQIIPYCILCHRDEDAIDPLSNTKGVTRYFFAQRRAKADRELAGRWTIGMGGHINPCDFEQSESLIGKNVVLEMFPQTDLGNAILADIHRELSEELEMKWSDVVSVRCIGIIYTEVDTVSMDHIGLAVLFEMSTEKVRVPENGELARGGFYSIPEFNLMLVIESIILPRWEPILYSFHSEEECMKYWGVKKSDYV